MWRIFTTESTSLQEHNAEETTVEQLIESVRNSVCAVEWKTEVVTEELRQVQKDIIEQQEEGSTPHLQLQFLKDFLQVVEQKTDVILEELRLLRAGPKEFTTPVEANPFSSALTLEGIKQFYVDVETEQCKAEILQELHGDLFSPKNVVVFVNTQHRAKWLTDILRDQYDIPALTIHGDMEQNTREDIMRQFRTASSPPLLISTDDVLAPGLDVYHLQVSLVINYDLPTSLEKYLHRVGKSAWLKRKGFAINFVTRDPDDEKMIFDIQRFCWVIMEELPYRVDGLFQISQIPDS